MLVPDSLPAVPRQPGKRCLHFDFIRPGHLAAIVSEPHTGGESDLSCNRAFLQNRGNQNVVSEHELVGYVFVASFREIPLFTQKAEHFPVRANEWANPQHNAKSKRMQPVNHSLGIGKPALVKGKRPVVFMPVVVDHQNARRKPVRNNRFGVSQHLVLRRMIAHLHPGIVLRNGEKQQNWEGTGRREVRLRCMTKRIAQMLAALLDLDRSRQSFDDQLSAFKSKKVHFSK